VDSHELAQRYEAIRRDVVQPSINASHDVRGLALLVRKGMAAWMHALSQRPCTHAAVGRPGCDESSSKRPDTVAPADRRAAGIEQVLVNILAAMTQANAIAMEA
jgi:hypothetical protein